MFACVTKNTTVSYTCWLLLVAQNGLSDMSIHWLVIAFGSLAALLPNVFDDLGLCNTGQAL
jgi:hypothetical protein